MSSFALVNKPLSNASHEKAHFIQTRALFALSVGHGIKQYLLKIHTIIFGCMTRHHNGIQIHTKNRLSQNSVFNVNIFHPDFLILLIVTKLRAVPCFLGKSKASKIKH